MRALGMGQELKRRPRGREKLVVFANLLLADEDIRIIVAPTMKQGVAGEARGLDTRPPPNRPGWMEISREGL